MHASNRLFCTALLALSVIASTGNAGPEESEPITTSEAESMHAIFVVINVKPEHVQTFTEASIVEARGTVGGEPGVFQFHMLTDKSNPNRFYFFEIFRDEAAVEAHWETENFKIWWNTIEGMLDGEPETISTMRTVFPSTQGLEKQKVGLKNW